MLPCKVGARVLCELRVGLKGTWVGTLAGIARTAGFSAEARRHMASGLPDAPGIFGGSGLSRLAVPWRQMAAGDTPVGRNLVRQTIVSRPCRTLVR